MRLFSWLLDCRASLAMTGSVQRRPLPVIARRSCAAAIQSFSVRRPEEAAFDQCFGHLFLFRRACAETIQSCGANARKKLHLIEFLDICFFLGDGLQSSTGIGRVEVG